MSWEDILKAPMPTLGDTAFQIFGGAFPKSAQHKINPEYTAKIEQLGKEIADIYDELADAALWDKTKPSRATYDGFKSDANKLRTSKPIHIITELRGMINKPPRWKIELDATLKWKDSEYKNKKMTLLRQIESKLKEWGWDWD